LASSVVLFHRRWRFRNSRFVRGGIVAPRPTLSLENQGLYFVWPLPFDLSGIHGPTRSLRSRQHSSPGHWGAHTSPHLGGSLREEAYLTQAKVEITFILLLSFHRSPESLWQWPVIIVSEFLLDVVHWLGRLLGAVGFPIFRQAFRIFCPSGSVPVPILMFEVYVCCNQFFP
jgi:hypothetical protein